MMILCVACGKTNMFTDGVPLSEKAKVEKASENSDALGDQGTDGPIEPSMGLPGGVMPADSAEGEDNANPENSEPVANGGSESSEEGLSSDATTMGEEDGSPEGSTDIAQDMGDTELKALNCSEALSLADTSGTNVVTISSQGGEEITFAPDTIVILNLSGQANIDLDSDDVELIRGLCINASGGARASIQIDFNVEEMSYFGRGNALTSLDFDDDGRFDRINVDISGTHELNIYGDAIDCSLLDSMESGGGLVHCDNFAD